MGYQNWRLLGILCGLTKVLHVIREMVAAQALSPFTLAVPSKVEGVTDESFFDEEWDEILLPAPGRVPRSVNEQQGSWVPFGRFSCGKCVKFHSWSGESFPNKSENQGSPSSTRQCRNQLDMPVQTAKGYLPIRGSQVYNETSGDGQCGLLHGGIGTNEDFASQTPELAKHFMLVAFEMIGHGYTAENDEPFSYYTMA